MFALAEGAGGTFGGHKKGCQSFPTCEASVFTSRQRTTAAAALQVPRAALYDLLKFQSVFPKVLLVVGQYPILNYFENTIFFHFCL